ncbi:MAG: endonuclease [Proteobacteria bacterium]|nr:endonuclease [Pseudomonadota bacterium]
MKNKFLILTLSSIITVHANVGDLLITELSVTPFGAEFIEIYNNGNTTIDLSNVYLTDATFVGGNIYYYQIVSGGGGGGGYYDFNARFPDGASIMPGDYQTVSINGSTEFTSTLGVSPTYELYEDDGSADSIPDMRPATPDSIATPSNTSSSNCPGSQTTCPSGLTDGGEVMILYTWDGSSDLVADIDYIVWGDTNEAIDKTGVSSGVSTYLPDTAIASQILIDVAAHASSNSWQRIDLTEGTETKIGGNGVNGHDETSENTNVTFIEAIPTPNIETGGVVPPGTPNIIINEVDAVGTAEFIELYDGGDGNTDLAGVTVVLFDGDTDLVYAVYDLATQTTDANGYFLLGNATTPAPDVILADNSVQDGADAVALYFESTLAVGDTVTATAIIDAFVYDSDDADDSGLLSLLNTGQAQINENANSQASTQSNARCSNGSGGVLNTATYTQTDPTPGNFNNTCPDSYYASITPAIIADPVQLRTALHNLIDNHTVGSYSFTCTMLSFADEDPTDTNKVWMVYSNESFNWLGNCSGQYNREHTWPRSRFFGDENTPTNSDIHHLMLSNKNYNSSRGSLIYDNCTSGSCNNTGLATVANQGVGGGASHADSNWKDGSKFEVWNFRKGDIARAMFYIDVRYSGDVGNEYDLQLTDDSSLMSSSPYMGKLSTLCEWHKLDPVDDIERHRNEVVYSYQDNKNPFINHPEWVAKVFTDTPACQDDIIDLIFTNGFEAL